MGPASSQGKATSKRTEAGPWKGAEPGVLRASQEDAREWFQQLTAAQLWDVRKIRPLCFKSLGTRCLPEEKPLSYHASVLAKSLTDPTL